jgi:type IV secretory pathway TraG/TraD family ATPase VirD4
MSGSLLSSRAESFGPRWRDYWGSVWHRQIPWHTERIRCFLDPAAGRTDLGADPERNPQPLVSDFPRGTRPFLGVVTQTPEGAPSPNSGVLELNDDGHLLTIAPTRSGKGAAHIVPNLLLYAGSCLVIDIKGENYDITAAHRARMFDGARIIRFAPFEPNTDTYNPIDFIRVGQSGQPSDDTFDDARLLAEMLIPTGVREEFWDIEARNLLTMLLYHVAVNYPGSRGERNMASVAHLLFRPSDEVSLDPANKGRGLDLSLAEIAEDATDLDLPVLKALHSAFVEHEPKVRSGIVSTCRSRMQVWLSPNLQRATAHSSFQFSELKASMCRPVDENPAPTTIYVVIPPEYLSEYRPILRVMAGLAAVELTRPASWAKQPGYRAAPPCPVLLLLDEFPSLGAIRPIANGLAYLAGYGVQVWTFAQSLGQLKDLYGENWTTFAANAAAISYFGVTDTDLAELISRQLGTTAEYAHAYQTTSESVSESEGISSNQSSSSSFSRDYTQSSSDSSGTSSSTSTSRTTQNNVRYKQDPVASVADIRALPRDVQIVLMRNKRPILATLLPYWKTGLFGNLYGSWGR